MARLRGDSNFRGDAFHQLFMGRDTDEAEAAANMLGTAIWILTQQNVKEG
jgi:hypothetical protein